jgi:hypothetical protein
MTELSAYSLDPFGIVVYTQPQPAILPSEITSIQHYLSVLHSESGHPQIPQILIQLRLISTAMAI